MYDFLIAPFIEFEFMRRALVGAFALALGGAPVGVFLMLRRMSLTGDAMAHAILPGAAVGFLVSGLDLFAMTVGGIVAGFTVALGAGLVARTTELKEDASLAAFYLVSLALGVLIVSLKGSNIDLLHVLFGSVLALDDATLILIAAIATISLLTLAILWRPLVLECVDPNFLRSVSGAGAPTHLAFLALDGSQSRRRLSWRSARCSPSALMMLPAAAARFWAKDLTSMIVIAVAVAVVSGVVGLLVSYHSGAAAGPAIILVAGVFYAVSVVLGPVGGLRRHLVPGRHLEA